MPQKVYEVAERYGRLRPVKYIWGRGWLCLCDCGNETVVTGGNLRAGNVQSCGCYRLDKCSETGSRMIKHLKDNNMLFGWDLYRHNRKLVEEGKMEVRPMLTKRKKSDKTKPCWCCRRPTKNFLCIKCTGENHA